MEWGRFADEIVLMVPRKPVPVECGSKGADIIDIVNDAGASYADRQVLDRIAGLYIKISGKYDEGLLDAVRSEQGKLSSVVREKLAVDDVYAAAVAFGEALLDRGRIFVGDRI